MFNSISNPVQKNNKNNLDVVQLAAIVEVICNPMTVFFIYYRYLLIEDSLRRCLQLVVCEITVFNNSIDAIVYTV